MDPSNPYAAMSASQAPAQAQPAAIRVEMDPEVMRAQKRGRSKVMVLALVTAGIGMVLGVALGGGMERGKRQDIALSGAKALVKEIDESNVQAQQLADVLGEAKQKLAEGKFPEDELSKLGAINIAFSGANLTTKGIGLFQSDVVTMLVNYASGASEANEQKERLQRVLGGAKPAIMDFLSQQKTPKVRWSVFVTNGPGGPWAAMQPLPEAFLVKPEKGGWPDKFEIKDGDKTIKLDRFTRGDPMKSDDPMLIPVNPLTQGSVCPSDTLLRLRREVGNLEQILRGEDTPGHETDGLVEMGNKLKDKLKLIGGGAA